MEFQAAGLRWPGRGFCMGASPPSLNPTRQQPPSPSLCTVSSARADYVMSVHWQLAIAARGFGSFARKQIWFCCEGYCLKGNGSFLPQERNKCNQQFLQGSWSKQFWSGSVCQQIEQKCYHCRLWNAESNFNKVTSKCGSSGSIMGNSGWVRTKEKLVRQTNQQQPAGLP